MNARRIFQCSDCEHIWELPFGTGRPRRCPGCNSGNIHREDIGGSGCGRKNHGRCRTKIKGHN